MRAAFLGMVSHELRAPLVAIKGSAATVPRRSRIYGAAEMEQFFRIIDEQADRMEGLIGDLLDAGRIEAGTVAGADEGRGIAPHRLAQMFRKYAPEGDREPGVGGGEGQPWRQPKFEVVACIAGRGFGIRREDMKKLLLSTRGKVFTLQNMQQLVGHTRLAEFRSR